MSAAASHPAAVLYRKFRELGLGLKILLFMVFGIVAGLVFGERATVVQPLGDLFIRLLMMAPSRWSSSICSPV